MGEGHYGRYTLSKAFCCTNVKQVLASLHALRVFLCLLGSCTIFTFTHGVPEEDCMEDYYCWPNRSDYMADYLCHYERRCDPLVQLRSEWCKGNYSEEILSSLESRHFFPHPQQRAPLSRVLGNADAHKCEGYGSRLMRLVQTGNYLQGTIVVDVVRKEFLCPHGRLDLKVQGGIPCTHRKTAKFGNKGHFVDSFKCLAPYEIHFIELTPTTDWECNNLCATYICWRPTIQCESTPPPIENGNWSEWDPSKKYVYGGRLAVNCSGGYAFAGKFNFTECQYNGTWSETTFTCLKIEDLVTSNGKTPNSEQSSRRLWIALIVLCSFLVAGAIVIFIRKAANRRKQQRRTLKEGRNEQDTSNNAELSAQSGCYNEIREEDNQLYENIAETDQYPEPIYSEPMEDPVSESGLPSLVPLTEDSVGYLIPMQRREVTSVESEVETLSLETSATNNHIYDEPQLEDPISPLIPLAEDDKGYLVPVKYKREIFSVKDE